MLIEHLQQEILQSLNMIDGHWPMAVYTSPSWRLSVLTTAPLESSHLSCPSSRRPMRTLHRILHTQKRVMPYNIFLHYTVIFTRYCTDIECFPEFQWPWRVTTLGVTPRPLKRGEKLNISAISGLLYSFLPVKHVQVMKQDKNRTKSEEIMQQCNNTMTVTNSGILYFPDFVA